MEKDSLLKNYLSDDQRFADLMNGFIFHGEQVIKPQDLQELVHYSMPVRGMVYDAGEYDKQLRGLKKAIRKRAGINID